MTECDGQRPAVIVLVVADREVPLGCISPTARCDLALIDDILRLGLAAARLGWSIRLDHVQPHLRYLIELVGVSERLGL